MEFTSEDFWIQFKQDQIKQEKQNYCYYYQVKIQDHKEKCFNCGAPKKNKWA